MGEILVYNRKSIAAIKERDSTFKKALEELDRLVERYTPIKDLDKHWSAVSKRDKYLKDYFNTNDVWIRNLPNYDPS